MRTFQISTNIPQYRFVGEPPDRGEVLCKATARELDLALRLDSGLKEDPSEPGVYADSQGMCYWCCPMTVEIPRRLTLRKDEPVRLEERKCWFRFYIKCYSGGYMDPDEYDEVNPDDLAFTSLDGAIEATLLETEMRRFGQNDNTCCACMGVGKENPLADEGEDCKKCQGKGWLHRKEN